MGLNLEMVMLGPLLIDKLFCIEDKQIKMFQFT